MPIGLASAGAEVAATPGLSVVGIAVAVIMMVVAMLSTVGAVLSFMFTMTLFRIPEENRQIGLGSVWVIVLPVAGVFWLWRVVGKLADSFRAYFESDEDVETPPGDFGMKLGRAMCIAAIGTHVAAALVVTRNFYVIGIALGVAVLLSIIYTIAYFRQVFRIRNRIPDPEQEEIRDYI